METRLVIKAIIGGRCKRLNRIKGILRIITEMAKREETMYIR